MSTLDLANGKWLPFSKALNKERGFYPNSVFYNQDDREIVVVIDRSAQGDDFALSQKAFDHVMAAQAKQDKVLRAFVILRDREANTVIAVLPASEVRNSIRDAAPQHGRFGSFWWIDKDFKRASSMELNVDPTM